MASRDQATRLGEISSTAILMNRYGMPQITETAANSAQPRALTRPASGLRATLPPAGGLRLLAASTALRSPAERGVHAATSSRACSAQQVDDVGRPVERVRDGVAVQEPDRRPELAAHVGEQRRPVRGAAVVEGGQPPDRRGVRVGRVRDGERFVHFDSPFGYQRLRGLVVR